MQKIMFDDRFGLTDAVFELRKNMTRRFAEKVLIEDDNGELRWNGEFKKPRYKVGEVVAVAQRYSDFRWLAPQRSDFQEILHSVGWNNKMYVRADLMPTRIRITSWRRERIQEICDEDCLKEGILAGNVEPKMYGFQNGKHKESYFTPREAFAALIKKMAGKKAWDDNPWVDVYEFELVI